MANWAWSALFGALLIVDWSFGSWLLKVRSLTSPDRRWRRARQVELSAAFIFIGIATVQLVALYR